MGEILVEMYHEVYGLDTVILRPLSLYGPGIWSSPAEHLRRKSLFFGGWLLKALSGETVEVPNADTESDLTYVKDAALAVDLALGAQALVRRTYNISSGTLVSHRKVAQTILKFLPQVKFKFEPGAQHNPLRPTRGPLDLSQARSELGYIPQYDLERGMKEYIGWLKGED
jgi:UDP-glucose 4-epimerase